MREASAFDFGWWQGEDGYRLYAKSTGRFVGDAPSAEAAMLWLLDHESLDEADPTPTSPNERP